jgi:hypothetical protein
LATRPSCPTEAARRSKSAGRASIKHNRCRDQL